MSVQAMLDVGCRTGVVTYSAGDGVLRDGCGVFRKSAATVKTGSGVDSFRVNRGEDAPRTS